MKTKRILKSLAIVGLVGGLFALAGCGVDKDVYNQAVAQVKTLNDTKVQLEQANFVSQEQIKTLSEDKSFLTTELATTQLSLDEKDKEVIALNEKIAKEVEESLGYKIDDLEIGASFDETLTDKEISLFDTEVEFDSDNYDAEETITLTGLTVANNEEDFGKNVYLTIPEEGVYYGVVFDSDLDTSEISDDETLVFNFLGEEVEVTEWDTDTITFSKGVEYSIVADEIIPIEGGQELKLVATGEDYAYIDVGGVGKKIYEGDTGKVNGVEVKVSEVLFQPWLGGKQSATIEVGEEVTFDVEDGDDYDKDGLWVWSIDSNSIGITLAEEFTDIDEDEDYKALAELDTLSLPNDFAVISFDGLDEETLHDFTFETDTKSGSDYIKVKGSFVDGLEDYDKVFINASGIYDEDLELIDSSEIEMEDTEFNLETNSTHIIVDDVVLPLDLSAIYLDGEDISGKDEDMLSTYGIEISEPEDSLDAEKIKLSVPEEQRTATVTVKKK